MTDTDTSGGPPSALMRLAEIVEIARAKSQSHRISQDLEAASTRVREFGARLAQLKELRPGLVRELALAEDEEKQYKSLVKQAAQLRGKLTAEESAEMERTIEVARSEITSRTEGARKRMAEVDAERQAIEPAMRDAVVAFQRLRGELSRINEDAAGDYEDVEQLAEEYEQRSVWVQARRLRDELDRLEPQFGQFSRQRAYAQLKVLIGTFRKIQDDIQDMAPADVVPEEVARFEPLFFRLVRISKDHEPGFIDAFNRDFVADWDSYVAEARARLAVAQPEPSRRPPPAGTRDEQPEPPRRSSPVGLKGGLH